ncbi:EamA family transporter [Rhizobium sp. L1K21]|uniref:EamA family transporter n=1 Tax=Rhizobium sp. L1K21 TaxID=2954933 RepID=UPI002092B2A2|nr:EamA family transporter [Rhizobium sp. L1K21]MCO6185707.1 EamA family transporter [Rhizobium sp. L1K21]
MRPVHIALALMVALVWGFNFVVIQVGIDNFPPIFFSALRFFLAALPLALILPRPNVPYRIIFGIGMFLGVFKFSLLFVGMKIGVPPGLASLVLQMQAFFTVILAAVLLKERPTSVQIVGIAIAFAGIGLIMSTVEGDVSLLGLFMLMGAAFFWACSNLLMKKAGSVDMLRLMVHVSVVAPLPLLLISLVFEGWQADYAALMSMNWLGFGATLYIAYGATIFGFAAWGFLIRTYGAGQVAPFSLLVPIFGMSSAALVLGEEIGTIKLVAAVLVIVGLMLVVMKRLPASLAGLSRKARDA